MLLHHRYQIIRDLAEGSFGKTFLAEDTQMPTRQRCVIKQLKPINDDRPEVVQLIQERFAREAAVLETVGKGHSQIPNLLAYFETDGQFYLVQEWIEGTPLSELVQTPWPAEKVSDLLASALKALAHVHAQNIIHRDIKPDNIILRQSDQLPCLIDFGAVKELMNTVVVPSASQASSVVIGTLGFMAPEQAVGRPVFSSDLYSLGMTAIYLLTARSPLEIPTDSLNGRLLWDQFAPNVSPRLAGILTRAIHPYPPTRFASATDMLEVLTQQTTQSAGTLTADTPANKYYSLTPASERKQENNSLFLKVGGAVVGALLVGTVFLLGYRSFSSGFSSGFSFGDDIDASSPEKLAQAIAKLEKAVESRPNDTAAQLKLIEGYISRGDYDTAMTQIDTLLPSISSEDETTAEALYWKGNVQITQGNYAAAIATLSRAVEADRDNTRAINLLGRAYQETGQYDDALVQFQAAAATDPDYVSALVNQASIEDIRGEDEAAEAILEKAGTDLKDDEKIGFYTFTGNFYIGLEDTEKAETYWKNASNLTAQSGDDYAAQGLSKGLLGNIAEAMDSFEQALAINPNSTDTYIARGIVHYRQGNNDAALADVASALDINPNSVGAYQLRSNVEVAIAEPDVSAAIESATKALEINPNHPNVLSERCGGHFLLSQFEQAIADCTKSIEVNPGLRDSYNVRGQSYFGQQDYKSAEKDFTRVIELNDAAGKSQTALVYSARAVARAELDDNAGAQADLTAAIALSPDEPDYYKLRGMLRFIDEDQEGAGEDLRKAGELYTAQGEEDEDLKTMIGLMEQLGLL